MIKLDRTSVMNMDNAIRGARNPMNSWDRMDSGYKTWEEGAKEVYPEILKSENESEKYYCLGEKDLGLAIRLRKAGSDHRKYLRQVFVSVDVIAPLYWWKEYDTYKVATVANSCSTMHKISAKEFTREDFSCDKLSDEGLKDLDNLIERLEIYRKRYLNEDDLVIKKQHWWDMIQLLPTSYNQMRTCSLNYETLINIYNARKNHKLDEWHVFCDWIKTLPYAKELILCEE